MKDRLSYYCSFCHDKHVLASGQTCPECCEHNEHKNFMCLDCGRQGDPTDYYDEDYDRD